MRSFSASVQAREPSLRAPPFDVLSPLESARIAAAARVRSVARRERLYGQGDRAEHAFVVLRGAVLLCAGTEDGRTLGFDLLGEAETFGLVPFLDDGPRAEEAVAIEDGMVAAVPYRALAAQTERRAPFALALARFAAAEARRARGHALELAAGTVSRRLAEVVLRLAGRFGVGSREGVVIDVGIVQQDLAALVGVSRETLNRHLSALSSAGSLGRRRRGYVVRDTAALEREAGGPWHQWPVAPPTGA
ncbi:MAG: Crp/Fnr family transcriptional regulator [Actinomycetota bacterium]